MDDSLILGLFIVGLAMFVVGDLLWLWRNTFNRPMDLRVTGGLVGGGITLISIGLLAWALTAGGN